MSIKLTPETIDLAFKFTMLGMRYFEGRQQRKIEDMAVPDVVDSVDEALREFEGLNVPEAYAIPDDEPLLIPPKIVPDEEPEV